jgi:UDP-N-acetylglucosamine transferase subunit ALG13
MASFGQTKRTVVSGDGVVIFVTVGAQMPFDRLVKAVDQWARTSGRDDVFAQIGLSEYRPSNMQWTQFLSPDEFKHKYETAGVIVAHAGTGSLITALQLGKPILIMPRRASLRETRNDHQVATSEHFRRYSSVTVAWDENELIEKLSGIDILRGDTQCIEPHASHELIKAMREFIDGNGMR